MFNDHSISISGKLGKFGEVQNHGNPTGHKPELVLNNFTTRLGHRVGR